MESLKSFARRTTQGIREFVSRSGPSPVDVQIAEVTAKVRVMEAKSSSISEKVIRVARLMEELGTALREIGEEYRAVPDLAKESKDLAEDVYVVGTKLIETSQEHQIGLKDNSFELLLSFTKQCAKLREVEGERRHHQLEYDFFTEKVQDLRKIPQKDFTRLPRNEQIMEGWRTELWRVTEHNKALCSQLYVDGRRAIDKSVLTTIQVLHSFVDIASTGFSQTFQNVRLPSYSTVPVLPPCSLPPPPSQSRDPSTGPPGPPAPTGVSYLSSTANSGWGVSAPAPTSQSEFSATTSEGPITTVLPAYVMGQPPVVPLNAPQVGRSAAYEPPPVLSSQSSLTPAPLYQPPSV